MTQMTTDEDIEELLPVLERSTGARRSCEPTAIICVICVICGS